MARWLLLRLRRAPGRHHRLQPIGGRWLASRRLAYGVTWLVDCIDWNGYSRLFEQDLADWHDDGTDQSRGKSGIRLMDRMMDKIL
jgi:hypothetical protein